MPARLRIKPGLLQRLREQHSIPTEGELARIIGVDPETLSRINEGGTPSGAFIAALCETFDLEIGEAFEIVSAQGSPEQ